ncbi:MAG: hypothetical protein LDLANPLL_01994 [Turneriella sp.]|nr:hypothetical protein [Turneriella sp.]
MKHRKFVHYVFVLLAILLTIYSKDINCKCELGKSTPSSSSGTTPAPISPSLVVTNNYGVAIAYELWRGTKLEYSEGTVLGNDLTKISSSLSLANSASSAPVTVSNGTSVILIVGVQDGADYVYVTHAVFNSLTANKTFVVKTTGEIQ